jgi:class 3 adenylate cyclase
MVHSSGVRTELAHILFADIVGYSKNSTGRQGEMRASLRAILEASPTYRQARTTRFVVIETGDGMAVAFFDHPVTPLLCAREIALACAGTLPLRMGIHSGLIAADIDGRGAPNLYGDGINVAQRVMDCGQAGHILLSRQAAETLLTLDEWRGTLHNLGDYAVKHTRVGLYNYYDPELGAGNPAVPPKGIGRWLQQALGGVGSSVSAAPVTVVAHSPLVAERPPVSTPPPLAPETDGAPGARQLRPAQAEPRASATELGVVAIIYKRNSEPDGHVLSMLEKAFTSRGYRVFIDRHLTVGIEWAQTIERELRSADYVVPLISSAAVHSDMLEYELQVVHRAGTPRLLPVRLGFTGPLPQNLAAILDPIQYTVWNGPEDDERLADELAAEMVRPAAVRQIEATGGAVPLSSQFYIVRSTDAEFLTAIERRDSIVLVKGPRQIGKTSLLARGLQRARDTGAAVAFTDFQGLTEGELADAQSLLQALCRSLKQQLRLDVSIRQFWDDDFSPNQNLESFLRNEVLEKQTGPFVWGLDEVDRLFGRSYGSEVFGLFRTWHNRRAAEPTGPWHKLTLALAYATEAHLFISDLNQSPFNVGTRLQLQDFDSVELGELNARYGSPLRSMQERDRFYSLLGGHPYLVRRGMDALATARATLDQLEAEADRDEGPFGDHLRRFLVLIAQDAKLLDELRGLLLRGGELSEPVFYRLRAAGMLQGESRERPAFRCRLYETYLRRHLALA